MTGKRSYTYIELWKRKAIIQCALDKSKSIKKCAKDLGVKYITAKHIVKLFKKTGRIETKCSNRGMSKEEVQAVHMNYGQISMPKDYGMSSKTVSTVNSSKNVSPYNSGKSIPTLDFSMVEQQSEPTPFINTEYCFSELNNGYCNNAVAMSPTIDNTPVMQDISQMVSKPASDDIILIPLEMYNQLNS